MLWKTVKRSDRKERQSEYEDAVIERLHQPLQAVVRVTLLADRGFGDQARYEHLDRLGFSFVIRFRENILVESAEGESKTAAGWVPNNGRAKHLGKARVTADRTHVGAVVCVKSAGMAQAWCLATNRTDLSPTEVSELYGRRFTIEETFRDRKDLRFGGGCLAPTSRTLRDAIVC